MVNFLILFSTLAFGAISNPDRAIVERGYNTLKNSSFESAKSGWTASGGSFTISNTAANVFEGVSSATWDSNGAAQTLTGTLASVNGLAGTNGELTCYVKVPSGTATHTMGIWDGSTLSQTQTLVNTSTNYIANTINFVFPSSGSIGVRFTSVNANEPSINIDKCYMGPATNLSQVSQAKLIDAVTVTGCAGGWSTTSTSYATFGTQTGCTYTSAKGLCTTPATNIPGVKCSSLPPGDYRLEYEGAIEQGTTAKSAYFKFYDGTNSAREDSTFYNNGTGGYNIIGISQSISYTTASSNLTLEVRGKTDASGTTKIYGTTAVPGVFKIWYFPSQTQLAVQPSQQNYDWRSYTPTTNGLGTPSGIECQSKREGSDQLIRCKLTAGTTTSAEMRVGLDGVTASGVSKIPSIQTCGQFNFTSTNSVAQYQTLCEPGVSYVTFSAINASFSGLSKINGNTLGTGYGFNFTARIPIEGWIQTNANPAIVGQVGSNTSGQERIERAYVNGSAGTPTFADVTRQSGSWLTALTTNSAGNVTLTIASGIFSSTPDCQCTCYNEFIGLNQCSCSIDTTTAPSSTAIRIQTNAAGNTVAGRDFSLMCMGPK